MYVLFSPAAGLRYSIWSFHEQPCTLTGFSSSELKTAETEEWWCDVGVA